MEYNPRGEQDNDDDQRYPVIDQGMSEVCDSDNSVDDVGHLHNNNMTGRTNLVTSTYVWLWNIFLANDVLLIKN